MSAKVTGLDLWIGDAISDDRFYITIGKTKFKIDDIHIEEQMLNPAYMTFNLIKGPQGISQKVQVETAAAIIGQKVALRFNTLPIEAYKKWDDLGLEERTSQFAGFISNVEASISKDYHCIKVICYSHDAALLCYGNRHCKSYTNMTLEEIVKDVILDIMENTKSMETGYDQHGCVKTRYKEKIPYVVQYNESGWEFLIRLAKRYGEWLYTHRNIICFGDLDEINKTVSKAIQRDEVLEMSFPNKDVISFEADCNIKSTNFFHVCSSYNSNNMLMKGGDEEAQKELSDLNEAAYQASKKIFRKATIEHLHVAGDADRDSKQAVLDVSTKATARAQKAGMVEYYLKCYSSKVVIGRKIVVKEKAKEGKGEPIYTSDPFFVTALNTDITADHRFVVSVKGLPASCDYPDYSDANEYPHCPPCRAKVVDNEDPSGIGRIKVQFDWQAAQDPTMCTPWLRIAQPYAGSGKGFSFIPEMGEEVMVDFEGGNGERPFVIGTMYNGIDKADDSWLGGSNDSNRVKAIRTRNGHTIEFHDENEEDGGYLRIYNNKNNSYVITLNSSTNSIMIESKGDIEMVADHDIRMHAKHDLQIEADNDISVMASKGIYAKADGDCKLTVKGDHEVSVQHNEKITVEQNQTTEVNSNYELKVKNQIDEKASSIRVEGQQEIKESAPNISIKADSSYGVSSNGTVDIKGNMTKIN